MLAIENIENAGRFTSAIDAIIILRDDIMVARKKGYTWEDIADILKGQGIPATESTVKHYCYDRGRRECRTKRWLSRKEKQDRGEAIATILAGCLAGRSFGATEAMANWRVVKTGDLEWFVQDDSGENVRGFCFDTYGWMVLEGENLSPEHKQLSKTIWKCINISR